MAFQLRLLLTWKIHDVFHASLLSSYKETVEHGPNYSNFPGDLISGEEEFELDRILSHCGARGRRQYLVSWKGYSTAENTWEPEENLKHAQTILRAYKLRHPQEFPNPRYSQQTTMSHANQMPIHSSHLLYSQCHILYSTLLANPITTMLLEQNPLFRNSPILTDLSTLFRTFSTLCLIHQQISPQDLLPVYAMAMQTAITEARALILDMLHSEGMEEIIDTLSEGAVLPILHLKALSSSQHTHYL
jgi:hypothetical protein